MAGENEDGFDDLPPIGQDGVTQETDKPDPSGGTDGIDALIDQHIADTTGQGTPPKRPDTNKDDTTQQRRGQRTDTNDQGTGRTTQRSQVPQQPRQIGSLFKSGADNAIYDAQGNKVANAGLERRVFERVQRYYTGMETEHGALKQQITAYREANAAAQKEGLSIEEHAMGLRLMSAWKKDPLQTMNFLLTQAQKQGTDVSSIRSGGGNVDMAAFAQAVKEQVAEAFLPFQPFVERLQEQREEAELSSQVHQDIAAFFDEFPDSEQHRPVLGAIMAQTGWNPREAWFALQAEGAKQGWDMTQPLSPQAQRTTGNGRGAAPTGRGNNPRIPSMNGRGGGGSGEARVRAGSLEAANADASWDDIIRDTIDTLPTRN